MGHLSSHTRPWHDPQLGHLRQCTAGETGLQLQPGCSSLVYKKLPWHQVQLHKPQRESKKQEQVHPGWHCLPPRVGRLFFFFFIFNIRTVLLILGTQELHPTNPSYVTAQSGLPQGNSQDDLNDSLLGISSVSILSKPCTAEPVITAGLLGYPETASLGALR